VLRELADEAGNYSDEWYPDTGQLEALLDDAEQFADAAPDAVRELADHLIERIERILDFGNCYGDLTEALGRAEDMHLDACLAGSPDPVLLSGRLIEGALDSGWGSFDTALPAYADLLGPDGMARYRELLAQASARGDKISDYTLGILHESLARAEGGTDAVVAMLAQQAGAAHDYVRIAEFLIADGRDDEALTGIARGMEVFPDSVQLPSLALDCHQRAGRRDQTLQMLWRLFTAAPSMAAYLKLKLEAGTEAVVWADRAIAHLRDRRPLPSAALAEILLAEGNAAAAWDVVDRDAAAAGFGLRMRVVDQRAQTHPADAIRVYQELATARAACGGSRAAYLEAVKYLRMAVELSDRSSAQEVFTIFMADLRAAHPGKKLLQQELTAAGLP
jgi:tetratricopeptide (TPR) repeat protein